MTGYLPSSEFFCDFVAKGLSFHKATINIRTKTKDANMASMDQRELNGTSLKWKCLLAVVADRVASSAEHSTTKLLYEADNSTNSCQHLRDPVVNLTDEVLAEEAKLQLENATADRLQDDVINPAAERLLSHVMDGNWQKAEKDLLDLKLLLENTSSFVEMKFLLLEQKYLEFLEDGRSSEAVQCLMQEVIPLNFRANRVFELCSCLVCVTTEELLHVSNWDGKGVTSRLKLMEKLRALLPPRTQQQNHSCKETPEQPDDSWTYQTSTNGLENTFLLHNHSYMNEQLPSNIVQVLTEHDDEVWFCQFSNDGMKLATGSKDQTVIIWDINPGTFKLTAERTFMGHPQGVSFLCWSPDDTYLIACCPNNMPNLWIWNVETGEVKICHLEGGSQVTAAWHKSGQKFTAASRYGQFYECDLDGNFLKSWDGISVHSLWCLKDGKTVLAADSHNCIRGYNFEEPADFNILQEDHCIQSFTCNKTEKLALLNVATQGVHLWNIEDCVLVKKFKGVTQEHRVIHSCFGGEKQMFAASGSEDGNVYIWCIKSEMPIAVLRGHVSSVNCVTWNPSYPGMLASASDDGRIIIWGSPEVYKTGITASSKDT